MRHLPLFFALHNRTVLVVGGGEVAYRKALLLHQASANLVVVAKHITADFEQFLRVNDHKIYHKAYDKADMQRANFVCVVCATDDEHLNRQVYQHAQACHLPINVVDNPALCDFIFPAIVDKDPITIGISSGGTAPVLTRLLRAKIESWLPSQLGHLAHKAGEFRQTVKESVGSLSQRRKFWEHIFGRALADGKVADLADELEQFIQNPPSTQGEVYIVGVGAGDIDLLTFKALRLMGQADVVLYDALVPQAVVDLCRRDSQKIFVGKKRHEHSKSQDEINKLLVAYAKKGLRVLRLKGGDPFVFGRGGEEMIACQKAGVAYQVVSGITSALAAASGANIPLTHRGVATSVRFLTACYQRDEHFDGLKSTYQPDETLVFYMGLHALDKVVASLKKELPCDTPVAIVANASLPHQQVLIGNLTSIVQKQTQAKLPAPAIIIVGRVVHLYQQ